VQIEAEAHAHEGPEETEPDERGAAIFARGPRCGCMDVQPCPPYQAEDAEIYIAELNLYLYLICIFL
jgi:hypothetical protein